MSEFASVLNGKQFVNKVHYRYNLYLMNRDTSDLMNNMNCNASPFDYYARSIAYLYKVLKVYMEIHKLDTVKVPITTIGSNHTRTSPSFSLKTSTLNQKINFEETDTLYILQKMIKSDTKSNAFYSEISVGEYYRAFHVHILDNGTYGCFFSHIDDAFSSQFLPDEPSHKPPASGLVSSIPSEIDCLTRYHSYLSNKEFSNHISAIREYDRSIFTRLTCRPYSSLEMAKLALFQDQQVNRYVRVDFREDEDSIALGDLLHGMIYTGETKEELLTNLLYKFARSITIALELNDDPSTYTATFVKKQSDGDDSQLYWEIDS